MYIRYVRKIAGASIPTGNILSVSDSLGLTLVNSGAAVPVTPKLGQMIIDPANGDSFTYTTTPKNSIQRARQKPIVALIGHSFAANHTNKAPIVSISRTGGIVTFTTDISIAASVGELYRISGCGYAYDNYFAKLTAANNGTKTYSYVVSDLGIESAKTPNNGYVTNLGSGGIGGGYNSAAWLAHANVFLNNAFLLPRSYIFPKNGGGFIKADANDPGFEEQCRRLSLFDVKPSIVVVDLGINDLGSHTIQAVIDAVDDGLKILNTWTKDIIFIMPRPSNQGSTVNRKAAEFTTRMLAKSVSGDFYVLNTRDRLSDRASTVGAMISGYAIDGLHINAAGAIQDGYAFAQQFGFLFPQSNTGMYCQTDAFDSSNNHYGDITGGGIFTAAGSVVTLDGTLKAVGNCFATVSGAGTSTATAQLLARTDTYADGTVIPGFELVIKFSAGSGSKAVVVTFGPSGSGNYSLLGPDSGNNTYAHGDELIASMEYSFDPASLGAGNLSPVVLELNEGGSGGQQITSSFADGTAITTTPVKGGVIGLPVLKVQNNSAYITCKATFKVSGTFDTTPTFRIKWASVAKNIAENPIPF